MQGRMMLTESSKKSVVTPNQKKEKQMKRENVSRTGSMPSWTTVGMDSTHASNVSRGSPSWFGMRQIPIGLSTQELLHRNRCSFTTQQTRKVFRSESSTLMQEHML